MAPGAALPACVMEMAAEKDVLESHDIIDNIERDFHDNDNIHLVIHYDPIQTGDRAVGTLHAWMEGQLKTISPQLSMHDFRAVPTPPLTLFLMWWCPQALRWTTPRCAHAFSSLRSKRIHRK